MNDLGRHKKGGSFTASFLALFLLGYLTVCEGSQAEKQLIDKLLDGYDPMVRPVKHFKQLVNVTFTLSLAQIVDLDEKNQLLTTSMYMVWSWHDTYLQWDPNDYGGIENIRLPAKRLWKPDILIYNSAVPAFDQMLKTNLVIASNGHVEWLPPGLFQTTCDVDIRYFPFDEQKCQIKFGAWTYHGGLVDLVVEDKHAVLDSYTESGEWDLLSMSAVRTAIKYDCCPDPFVDVTYTVHIRRRTLFYGFNLILPCILVCSLTILVFLLPADSGERITLGITILLALVVFLQLVADNLPPTDVIPLLGKYFACSIVMVTASVLATVVSLNFHHTTAGNANKMPKVIRWVFLYALPYILRMKRPGANSCKRKFLDRQGPEMSNGSEDYPLVETENFGKWDGSKPINDNAMTEINQAQLEMNKILDEIRFITKRMHNDDEDEKSALEWQFAATVLDKFCLWFFILYFIFSTLFTIGIAPGVLVPLMEH